MLVLGTFPFLSIEIRESDNRFRALILEGTSWKCLRRMQLLLLENGAGHQTDPRSSTGPCRGRNSATFLGKGTLGQTRFVKVYSSFQGDICRGMADSIQDPSYSRLLPWIIFEFIRFFRIHELRHCISLPWLGFSLNFSPATQCVFLPQGNC